MAAVGLQTHIWANNTRSMLLLAGFPVMLVGVIFGIQLILMGLGYLPASGGTLEQDIALAMSMLWGTIPLALVVAGVWFLIAWNGSQTIIDVLTGASKVERTAEPDLYNLLENLAISRGMATPTLRIIEQPELNAFASGLREGHYSVTVTRGLIDALDRDEMEAVLAHELTHVINKDVRTMVIASIFAGIITVIAELVFRGIFYIRGGRDNKNAGPLLVIGFLIALVGFALAIVIRLMLSRSREFVADAGAVELTRNPDAMISALRKVEGRSMLTAPDEVQGLFLDNRKEGFIDGLFATHPSIDKRVAALIRFGGGRDPGPWDGEVLAAPPPFVQETPSTSVPAT
jgi:heat shock protein HtpX